MSTRISILFGEFVTDSAIHNAVPLPAGVYEAGTPSIAAGTGGKFTPTLAVGGDHSVFTWRTAGSDAHGRHTIREDAAIVLTDGISAQHATLDRIDLIVGCHHWVDGPTSSGHPTGATTAEMMPYYTVVTGTPAANPVAPTPAASYTGPNSTGGEPVILAKVFVPKVGGGSPTIEIYNNNDLRLNALLGRVYSAEQAVAAAQAEINAARNGKASLDAKIDDMDSKINHVQSTGLAFDGTAPGGGAHTYTLTISNGVLTQTY